jgi:hypothetical protein
VPFFIPKYLSTSGVRPNLAALLRVLDQNWHDISCSADLPREGRSWLKELQTVRNKWSHRSSSELQAVPASEVYRDADTLGLLLGMIEASQLAIDAVEKEKSKALSLMTGHSDPTPVEEVEPVKEVEAGFFPGVMPRNSAASPTAQPFFFRRVCSRLFQLVADEAGAVGGDSLEAGGDELAGLGGGVDGPGVEA